MVRIRLTRLGARNRPFYRVVVADSRARRDGAFIDTVGVYDPLKGVSRVNHEKIKFWLQKGAQPTDIVKKLIQRAGVETAQNSNGGGK